jgi:hypothetical protein
MLNEYPFKGLANFDETRPHQFHMPIQLSGYPIFPVCLFVCLFVCLLLTFDEPRDYEEVHSFTNVVVSRIFQHPINFALVFSHSDWLFWWDKVLIEFNAIIFQSEQLEHPLSYSEQIRLDYRFIQSCPFP